MGMSTFTIKPPTKMGAGHTPAFTHLGIDLRVSSPPLELGRVSLLILALQLPSGL